MQTSCLGCGVLIPVGSRKGRCNACRTQANAGYERKRAAFQHRKTRPYASSAWQQARRTALARAQHTCTTCGITTDLTVHHIDHNAMNNTQSNLRVLCRRCHATLEATERRLRLA